MDNISENDFNFEYTKWNIFKNRNYEKAELYSYDFLIQTINSYYEYSIKDNNYIYKMNNYKVITKSKLKKELIGYENTNNMLNNFNEYQFIYSNNNINNKINKIIDYYGEIKIKNIINIKI